MYSFLEEMFLHDYFTFNIVISGFCDEQAIFDCLAKKYYLGPQRSKELFSIVTSKKVSNISSLKDYKQYCRLCQYAQVRKLNLSYSDEEDYVLTIKGKVLNDVSECGLADMGNKTRASVYDNIIMGANVGIVTALRIYGVLQCEGIFFEKSVHDGIKNLKRAARWNSIESVLALLQYDNAGCKEYIDMLHTLAAGTPYEEIAEIVLKSHPAIVPKKIRECILLSKVFGRGQVNPNVYLPVYANLLYSEIVPFNDKEKLLLSESKESVISYMDLPLKLTMQKLAYDVSAITGLSLSRIEEQSCIIQNAQNSDIRHFKTFRPLCLCSDSKYMRNYYASAISKLFCDAHVEHILVADLCPHDIEPTMNNIFVRSCNEDKGNVFIISFVGDVDELVCKAICDFLQSAKRGKMHLAIPGIEINLSSVLPICLCDKDNANVLSQYCEKIDIATPNHEEQKTIIQELIAEKGRQYGIMAIEVEDEIISKLCTMPVDAAELALDVAITSNRRGQEQLKLSEINAGKYIKKRESSRGFGYGGRKNDN